MSKRGSDGFGGDEERYGGPAMGSGNGMNGEDPPQKATAAQLARRKIASMKKPGARGRSGSPAVNLGTNAPTGGMAAFGQSQPQQQQPANPFSSTSFDFSFGQPPQQQQQQQQQQQPQNGGAFQFGASAPAPSQPNGGSNKFGQSQNATPSFGSFNAGSTQPSTNGFNPSTSSLFPQSQQQTTTPTFGGFGATQQNGATPATTTTTNTFGSFGTAQNGVKNGTPSFSFGGAPQADTTSADKPVNAFAGFGASQPQKEPEKPANPFAGFGATSKEAEKPKTAFAGFGANQQEKEKSATPFGGFGSTQHEKDTSRASTPFSGFGQTQQDKPSISFGGGFHQPQTNGEKPSRIFSSLGSKPSESGDKSSTPFGGLAQSKADDGAKQSNLFFGQTNGDRSISAPEKESISASSNIFGGLGGAQTPAADEAKKPSFMFGQSQAASQPEKPASNLFQPATQPNGEKKGLFGASVAPASTPSGTGSIFDNLPKKDLSNGGKPLFSSADPSQIYRPEEDDEEDTNNAEAEGGSKIFGQSSQKPMFAASQTTQNASKPTSNLFNFGSQTPSGNTSQQDTSMTTPSGNTTQTTFSFLGQTTAGIANTPGTTQAPARSLFDRIDKDDVSNRLGQDESSNKDAETSKASFLGAAAQTPATAKPLFTSTPGTSLFAKSTETVETRATQNSPTKNLFEKPASQPTLTSSLTFGTSAAPATTPSNQAFSATALVPADLTAGQKTKMKQLNNGLLAHLRSEDPEQNWTAILQYYMKMASQLCNLPLPSDATAPVSQPVALLEGAPTSNLFSRASPASTVQTPKPTTAAGIFSKPPSTAPLAGKKRSLEQDDNQAQPPATEKRTKISEPVSYPKLPESSSSTSRLFEAALDKSKSSDSSKPASTSTFNPSTKSLFSASTSTSTTSKPATGGFKPTSSTSAAGSTNFLASFGKAAKANEEKERKKRKADDYDSEDESEEAWEKRDREEQEAKRAKLAEAAKNAKGFSISNASSGGSEPPKTPAFKFDSTTTTSTTPAVPPPKLGSLFGSLSKQSTVSAVGTPAASSILGPASSSVEASRATTPGVITDGEASNAAGDDGNEPSDEPEIVQTDDQTLLQPAERDANDILLEIPNGLVRKFSKQEGEEKPKFVTQGEGRVYVLKDKTTGKIRILSRVGMGKLVLNFNPLKGTNYQIHAKKDNLVLCDFVDHINYSPAKPDRFYITTGKADEAQELARLMNEGAAK